MKNSLLKAAVGLALFGLAGAALAQPGAAFATLHPATSLRGNDMPTGALEATQPIHVVITLKLRNEAQLDKFLADPHHAVLSPEQFTERYSPTQAQAKVVANFLSRSGFKNVEISSNRLLVSADGRADLAQDAFQTKLIHVLTHDGREAFANSSEVRVPVSMQGTVQAVLGLQTVHQGHTFAKFAQVPGGHVDATTGTASGHNPTNFASIYGDSSLATASSVPVGIVTEGKLTNILSDLSKFTTQNGLPAVTTQTVNTNGTSTDTSGDGEWDLDSQDIEGISGGVQKIIFYNIPSLSDANMTADFNAIVTANAVKVINVSIGECESDAQSDGSAASDDTIFKQADAQGQTFSISTGDSGADECGTGGVTPSWPATSQYVIAAGGTELFTSGTTTWASETVWNELSKGEGATGGSPSTFEPMPSWQSGVGQNAGHTKRGVPDIAFDGDPESGALVIVDGAANQQIGGTSLSSPLFVGTWARVLQAKGQTLGFAAPLIYADAAAHASTDFHDVTSGNNSGETAAAGWDYTTGFGSIIGSSFVANVGGGAGGTAPVASNGSVSTNENSAVSGSLSATGTGDTFAIVANPAHGSVTITNSATGAFTYTPASGFSGSDSFTFHATNSSGTSNTATESVTVNSTAVNPPTASNGSVTTAENAAVNGTLSATGTGTLTFAVVAAPAHGTVSITNASTGAFTYTPTTGFAGSDSFTFDANNAGGNSNVATESVTVTAPSGGCAAGYTSFTGNITQGNDVFEPNNTYYQTTVTGTQSGILSGPAGKDYDLYLYKWNGSSWRVVKSSTGTTDNETINYSGTAGFYEWDIFAYSGSGSFQFCMKHPN
ncbi:MAG TPA: protease pro-enzyme activation domain-containing protein [Gammaproteobacteria bacterium]|jgi:subtilase family serine protease